MLRIKKQHDGLQALLKLREDLVQMVVQDLHNPVTNILFGLDILEILSSSSDEQRAKISQIRSSGYHLESLIDDLLLIAKMELGKLQLNRTKSI
jgi:signal transduction histidine kinase